MVTVCLAVTPPAPPVPPLLKILLLPPPPLPPWVRLKMPWAAEPVVAIPLAPPEKVMVEPFATAFGPGATSMPRTPAAGVIGPVRLLTLTLLNLLSGKSTPDLTPADWLPLQVAVEVGPLVVQALGLANAGAVQSIQPSPTNSTSAHDTVRRVDMSRSPPFIVFVCPVSSPANQVLEQPSERSEINGGLSKRKSMTVGHQLTLYN